MLLICFLVGVEFDRPLVSLLFPHHSSKFYTFTVAYLAYTPVMLVPCWPFCCPTLCRLWHCSTWSALLGTYWFILPLWTVLKVFDKCLTFSEYFSWVFPYEWWGIFCSFSIMTITCLLGLTLLLSLFSSELTQVSLLRVYFIVYEVLRFLPTACLTVSLNWLHQDLFLDYINPAQVMSFSEADSCLTSVYYTYWVGRCPNRERHLDVRYLRIYLIQLWFLMSLWGRF